MVKKDVSQNGSAMILSSVVVVILAGLAVAFYTIASYYNKFTLRSYKCEKAFAIAEAGLDDAINKMNAFAAATWKGDDESTGSSFNIPTSGSPGQYTYLTSSINNNMDYAAINVVYWTTSNTTENRITGSISGGNYSVTITPAYHGRGVYTITSIGTYGGEGRGISIITSSDVKKLSLDAMAAFGDVELDGGGNMFVDSYRSSQGTYASQLGMNPDNDPSYALANGDIGSNGPLSTGGKIYGDVYAGVGHTPTGGGFVYGEKSSLTEAVFVTPQTYAPPAGLAAQAFNGNANTTLGTPGFDTTFRYTSLSISAQKTLTIRGNVTIYVDGSIDMHGQSKVALEPGATLTIYQGSGDATLNGGSALGGTPLEPYRYKVYSASTGNWKFNGTADISGYFYAPHVSLMQNGNAVLYGKVVAKKLKITGTFDLHFDEDLKAATAEYPPVYAIKSWREFIP